MANIKKTFNFRNGVQVDEDNLIVNATGLVGIGTTIPTEALDVRGTAKVVGLVTSNEGFIGIFTAHTSSLGTVALSTSIIGAGVSIKSGIITSNSATGLVTYYGDARFLQGMPTSQWEDTDAGFGVTSIFNTGGTVGIATTNPQFSLQVGNNVNGGEKGVGISSVGNIKASGIITATTFSGNFNGSVDSSALNATGVSTLGVSTFTGAVSFGSNALFGDNDKILLGNGGSEFQVYHTGATSIIKSGEGNLNLQTASGEVLLSNTAGVVGVSYKHNDRVQIRHAGSLRFSTSGVGVTVYNQLDTTNMVVSGVSTFSEDVITGVGATVGLGTHVFFGDNIKATFGSGNEVKMYHKPDTNDFRSEFASTNYVIMTQALDFKNQAGNKATITAFEPGGIPEVRLFNDGNEKLRTTGFGVTIFNQLDTTNIVASGVITATTELNSPLVGVGTDDPATDIQVRKSGAAQIRVTSDSNAAIVSVGRESGAGNGNNGALRYGNESVAFDYSTNKSLDILNYSTGNINFNLDATNQVSNIGDFYWSKYNNPIMTLTSGGNLGIGITLPEYKLHVAGVSTFTGDVYGGNNLTIGGDLTVGGSFQINELIGNVTGNVVGSIESDATVGMNTISLLTSDGIGIGVTNGEHRLRVNFNPGTTFYVTDGGKVGIGTDRVYSQIKLAAPDQAAVFAGVGIGTTSLRSACDFGSAGAISNDPDAGITGRYMIPPLLDNAGRGNLQGLIAGAMIFNTDTNKLNVYNGTAWREVTDGAV